MVRVVSALRSSCLDSLITVLTVAHLFLLQSTEVLTVTILNL